jgi:hypothetical protein
VYVTCGEKATAQQGSAVSAGERFRPLVRAPSATVLALFDLDLHHAWPAFVAAVPVGLLLIAAINAWLSARNERARTQPVVICHESSSRSFSNHPDGAWVARVYLTNDGTSNAFNVAFGIRMRGRRLPWRGHDLDGPPRRYPVVRAAERVPAEGTSRLSIPLYLPSIEVWALAHERTRRRAREKRRGQRRDDTIDDGRVYWCRYENAQGHTWETLSPGDPTADLRIRRVYWRRLREQIEGWRERRLRAAGIAFDAQVLAEMEQARAESMKPPEEQGGEDVRLPE